MIGKPTLDPLHSGLQTGTYGEQGQVWCRRCIYSSNVEWRVQPAPVDGWSLKARSTDLLLLTVQFRSHVV